MKTLIVYHRGGGKSLGYPPNSITTFKWAVSNHAKAIEYDIFYAEAKKAFQSLSQDCSLKKIGSG